MVDESRLIELNNIQFELAKNIKIEKLSKKPRYIGGVDVAYWEHEGQEFGVCSVVVYDAFEKRVVEKVSRLSLVDFPYISGYLGFRECKLELKALECVKSKLDLLVVDGNGMLHPRKAGEAVQLGVDLDIPTIGVAKSYLKVDNLEYDMPDIKKGSYNNISLSGETVGIALRTMDNVKPVFVSIGNKITLEESYKIVMELCDNKSHIPIPTRLADIETHTLRKRYRETLEFKGEF